MDEETHLTGISSFEGYALGRLSERSHQVLGDAAGAFGRRISRPAAPLLDVNALIAENEMLRSQLAATQAELSNLEGDYGRLRAWGTQASQLLNKYGLIKK